MCNSIILHHWVPDSKLINHPSHWVCKTIFCLWVELHSLHRGAEQVEEGVGRLSGSLGWLGEWESPSVQLRQPWGSLSPTVLSPERGGSWAGSWEGTASKCPHLVPCPPMCSASECSQPALHTAVLSHDCQVFSWQCLSISKVTSHPWGCIGVTAWDRITSSLPYFHWEPKQYLPSSPSDNLI